MFSEPKSPPSNVSCQQRVTNWETLLAKSSPSFPPLVPTGSNVIGDVFTRKNVFPMPMNAALERSSRPVRDEPDLRSIDHRHRRPMHAG